MEWDKLQEEICQWACEKFGDESHISRIKHLREEVDELYEAFYTFHNPQNRRDAMGSEIADVLILLFHIAHCEGIDLKEAVEEKFHIVKNRNWLPPDEEGVIRHVKK